nr:MAG TPA: peptidoglycan hydrolase [Caudoviricetes sp.]
MVVNPSLILAWMLAREGKVTYSMERRTGPDSFDYGSKPILNSSLDASS